MKQPSILIRDSSEFGEVNLEFQIASNCFHQRVFKFRSEIPENSLVVGRYSVLPFYRELEEELKLKNSALINSYSQHRYIADITQWYIDLKKFTPKTYTEWGDLNVGSWIVKGKTSSRKHQWKTHMFAQGRDELLRVIRTLMDDSVISQDGLVVREYIPLKKICDGLNGLPIVKEWRLFFLGENYLAGGYYWSTHFEEYVERFGVDVPNDVVDFAKSIAKIVSQKTNFFVLDIAEKEDGGYILVEINDGQMSGLSCVEPYELYKELASSLKLVP